MGARKVTSDGGPMGNGCILALSSPLKTSTLSELGNGENTS